MATITMGLYHQSNGPRFRLLRAVDGPQMRRNWMAIITGMLGATLLGLLAVIVADNTAVAWVIACAACGFTAIRGLRLVGIMHRYLTIADLDAIDEAGGLPLRKAYETFAPTPKADST